MSGANGAALTFIVVFLITLTIGGVFLAVAAAKTGEATVVDMGESDSEIAASTTRVPFAEKVMSEGADDTNQAVDAQLTNGTETGTTATDGGSVEGESAYGGQTEDAYSQSGESEEIQQADSADGTEQEVTDSYWERNITASNDGSITLAFAGDILFDPGYAIMNRIRENGGAIEGVIGDSLLSYMRSADIMVVNNEFPYSDGGTPTEGKTFTFRAPTSSASYLNSMGVDVATLANNHTYDYGQSALLDTLSAIDNVGVARIGAGANIEDASHPIYYTNQNGLRVAIIAATEIERLDNPDTKGATDSTPGVFRCLDITRLQQRIREAKESGAFVIVCIHWGTENKEEIDWWQEKQGPEMVEAGADLIVGAHPHILQKIGYINGVPVIYSLGNFLFNSKTLNTGLLRVTVNTDHSSSLQFVPAIQSDCNVNEATGDSAQTVLNHLREISSGVSIDADGNITNN